MTTARDITFDSKKVITLGEVILAQRIADKLAKGEADMSAIVSLMASRSGMPSSVFLAMSADELPELTARLAESIQIASRLAKIASALDGWKVPGVTGGGEQG